MRNKTAWIKGLAVLGLLAITPFANLARAADARNLDGVWQCYFLETKNTFEEKYYSNWTFDAAKKEVVAFWSPVHKGDSFYYHWDGKQLVLDYPWGPPRPRFGTFEAHMQTGGTLVIEMPQLRWKGWRCQHQPSEQWPADGLQFLDYARYPWLSNLIEDGPSIMKYRDPKAYARWLKDVRRQ